MLRITPANHSRIGRQREAEEARQQKQDILEAVARRRAEEQYKSKGRVRAFKEGEKINSEIRQEIDNGLFELLMKLEERLHQSKPSSSLTLPLLSSSNKSSEVLLGAAIALCDHDLIRAIQLRIKHTPGLGLATISKESILLIHSRHLSATKRTARYVRAYNDVTTESRR